jgi:hypothetical protein
MIGMSMPPKLSLSLLEGSLYHSLRKEIASMQGLNTNGETWLINPLQKFAPRKGWLALKTVKSACLRPK